MTAFHAQWKTAEPKFRIVVHDGTISIGGAAAREELKESLSLEAIPDRHELKGFPDTYQFFRR